MAPPRGPLFLERQVYRRRRLMDAARMLPVLGLVALLLPPLWSRDGEIGTAAEAVYLFGLWFLLILAAFLLARPLREAQTREAPPPPAGNDAGAGTAEPSDSGQGPGGGTDA